MHDTSTAAGPAADTSQALGEQLRRWIIAAGYGLAAWAILNSGILIILWGLPFNRFFLPSWLIPIHRTGVFLHLTSPFLLAAGTWALQHRRPWSRPILLTYAGLWVAGLLAMHGVELLSIVLEQSEDWTLQQRMSFAMSQLDVTLYASVFPAALALLLMRSERAVVSPPISRGFAPVFQDPHRETPPD